MWLKPLGGTRSWRKRIGFACGCAGLGGWLGGDCLDGGKFGGGDLSVGVCCVVEEDEAVCCWGRS